jgi:hypothetical protein
MVAKEIEGHMVLRQITSANPSSLISPAPPDPRDYATSAIIDLDQLDAVDTELFAFNDDLDDTNDMIDLLRGTVERQTSGQLTYLRQEAPRTKCRRSWPSNDVAASAR